MTAQRVVVLGCGRKIGLGAYVRGWKRALGLPPDATIAGDLRGDYGPAPVARVLRQFREGMNDRINRHDPAYGKGRRWHHDHQRDMIQTAQRLNWPRLVLDQLPHWLPRKVADKLKGRCRGWNVDGYRDGWRWSWRSRRWEPEPRF